jgi:hypothetical protein
MSTLIRLFATNSKQADSNGLRHNCTAFAQQEDYIGIGFVQQEDFATR